MKKTSTERVKKWQKSQRDKGLSEVRGIYAKPEHHKKIKGYANKLEKGDECQQWALIELEAIENYELIKPALDKG